MPEQHDKEERTKTLENQAKLAFEANRQALVIIHGIGNQRPMETLRPFVDAVLGIDPSKEDNPQYYSKPDSLSGLFELRRLQSRDSRPRTDYFELYWQHLMPTATWRKMFAWLKLLLTRRVDDVPPALRGFWRLSWVLALAIIGLLSLTIVMWLFPNLEFGLGWLDKFASLPLGLAAVLAVLQGFLLNYVGDAAIYLSPDPRNIEARHAIREAGVSLVERLHAGLDSERRYDRIVLVGHSLGSVIGYDILTYAWTRFNEVHGSPENPTNEALAEAEKAAKRILNADENATQAEHADARAAWLKASRRLWLEQRVNFFPWLVTDFITLGSPLAHGLLLLARSRSEFIRKKAQRELPTCPPLLEKQRTFSYQLHYKRDDGAPRTVLGLHHAACFAVTRWTNLFFPVQYWLKGDLIGGKVAGAFGPGVLDIPVRTVARGGWLVHTNYWHAHKNDQNDPESAVSRLRNALDVKRDSFNPTNLSD